MLKNKLEAVLFASNQPLSAEDLARVCKESDVDLVVKTLHEIREELKQRSSSLMLVETHGFFRIIVQESFIPYVKKLVTKVELPKSIIETLAVIAYKSPVMQCNVIKIRTNKAYDHILQLEKQGFIVREKKGRSKLIKLSSRFFEYFDIPPEKLKERLAKTEDLGPLEVDTVAGLEVFERPVPEGEEAKAIVDGLETYGEKKKQSILVENKEPVVAHVEQQDILKPVKVEPPPKTVLDEAKEAAQKIESKPLKGKGLYEGVIPEEIKPRVEEKVKEIMSGESKE
ncbi:SMC-Scp complex subunit ScpB [Candidatus Woesearchaeota archaeon]|nr:SMC-Scp complex subunit ScpB [Candidatus Woesearchaeota archaeon]